MERLFDILEIVLVAALLTALSVAVWINFVDPPRIELPLAEVACAV